MEQYSKPQIVEVEIHTTERIANCIIGSIPIDLPSWVEIEEQAATTS